MDRALHSYVPQTAQGNAKWRASARKTFDNFGLNFFLTKKKKRKHELARVRVQNFGQCRPDFFLTKKEKKTMRFATSRARVRVLISLLCADQQEG